jgi:hypothetical protein
LDGGQLRRKGTEFQRVEISFESISRGFALLACTESAFLQLIDKLTSRPPAGAARANALAFLLQAGNSAAVAGRAAGFATEDSMFCTPRLSVARVVALAAAAGLAGVAPRGACAQPLGPSLELKPGQETTFAAAIADGRVALGPARLSKPGAAQPKDGEITVAVVKRGLSPYADLTATEKTSDPVDFVATALIGDIKIDEIVVCGRLDAPATARIASGAWRVSLNRFSVRPNGESCRR